MAPAQVPKTAWPSAAKLLDRFVETLFLQKLQLRGAFAAGKNQSVATIQVRGRAHFDGVDAHVREHGRVRCEIALNRKNPDLHLLILDK